MLILTRKATEQIYIGDDIVITLCEMRGNQAAIGIDAPDEIRIWRKEIYDEIRSRSEDEF